MIAKPIYIPRGRAKEYADQLALNIYTGCNHGCAYCWARDMYQRFRGICGRPFEFPTPRIDIVESVRRQLEREQTTGKLIHLCFTCDPYPAEIDTTPTREVIKAIKAAGNHIQILTKGGSRAERDFDLLDGEDWFGVTITGGQDIEKNAAPEQKRLASLQEAYRRGIRTWVSCEPVIRPSAVLGLIKWGDYINRFAIGKLNYAPSTIDWAAFGQECERLCIGYDRNYYIKDSLRSEMNKTGGCTYGKRGAGTA